MRDPKKDNKCCLLLALLLVLLLSLCLVYAAPNTNFVGQTPSNNTFTSSTSVIINTSITLVNNNPLNQIVYNWNGTNFTLYDNNSLVAMFNLDNISALGENDTYVVDLSLRNNNATAFGNAAPVTRGKYNGAFTFDGTGDYLNATNTSGFATGAVARTIAGWINVTNTATVKVPFAYGLCDFNGLGTSGGQVFGVYLNAAEDLNFWGCGAAADFSTGTTVSVDVWHHVLVTYDGTNVRVYFDGRQVGATTARTLNTNLSASSSGFFIGSDASLDVADYSFTGLVDEVRVWNRSLSVEEAYQQYASNLRKYNATAWELYVNQSRNATTGLNEGPYNYSVFTADNASTNSTETRIVTIDTTAPTVTLNTPLEGSSFEEVSGAASITFNWTANDNIDTSLLVNLSINGTVRQANIDSTNATPRLFTLSFTDGPGVYVWNVSVVDDAGNVNFSTETRNFTVTAEPKTSGGGGRRGGGNDRAQAQCKLPLYGSTYTIYTIGRVYLEVEGTCQLFDLIRTRPDKEEADITFGSARATLSTGKPTSLDVDADNQVDVMVTLKKAYPKRIGVAITTPVSSLTAGQSTIVPTDAISRSSALSTAPQTAVAEEQPASAPPDSESEEAESGLSTITGGVVAEKPKQGAFSIVMVSLIIIFGTVGLLYYRYNGKAK